MSSFFYTVQISFKDEDSVAVINKNNLTDRGLLYFEVATLAWMSLRVMTLIKQPYRSVFFELMCGIDKPEIQSRIKDVYSCDILDSPVPKPLKSFLVSTEMGPKGVNIKFNAKGFGIRGVGSNYYAPTAVFVLFDCLEQQYGLKNPEYISLKKGLASALRRSDFADRSPTLGEQNRFCTEIIGRANK